MSAKAGMTVVVLLFRAAFGIFKENRFLH